MTKKNPPCPNCGSDNIACIFWGYPANYDSLKKDLDQGKITLGGCCVTGNDPEWECNKCFHRWGFRDD